MSADSASKLRKQQLFFNGQQGPIFFKKRCVGQKKKKKNVTSGVSLCSPFASHLDSMADATSSEKSYRVKLYQLGENSNWEDKGTGYCTYIQVNYVTHRQNIVPSILPVLIYIVSNLRMTFTPSSLSNQKQTDQFCCNQRLKRIDCTKNSKVSLSHNYIDLQIR